MEKMLRERKIVVPLHPFSALKKRVRKRGRPEDSSLKA